ncbi:solute:sodium symporter family transporter [Tamlana sp. 2201CG12-4]|uniref:solute:sodium symporter family transporter n=1 Tax=Tamlana sp. 2201CG12-4 TaxID=3112582 RepID=UPI002DBA23BE|nr:solute:sodium symporter family transporter [Tamlana sp. 2201CG12-4]MEC3908501.1 solute:sodium symporter family transporter [Tamlana sp. 2201CG12-4]
MTLNFIDITAFIVFILLVIFVSVYLSRKEETSEDYFLAGRSLSWWVIGLSLIASNISTEHFIGQAGQGFKGTVGLAIASYEWIAAIALVIVAFFFLPRFLKSGIYTMPEYLGKRYDTPTRTFMSVMMLVFYIGVTMATVLYAGAFTLHTIFDIPLHYGVWTIGLIAGAYTVYGGLMAVVWSDVIQGSVLLLGGLIVTLLGFKAVGGIEEFVKLSEGRLHTILPADHPELPWTAVLIGGMWIPNLFYWGLNQFITQRTLGAKSVIEGQKGILFGATIKLIIPFIVIFPGIIAFELYGDDINNPDAAFPILITKLLPSGLIGILLAALFGATMSTLDSLLNSAATIFTVDIYKPFINPKANSKKEIKIGRIATLIFTVLACIWAPVLTSFEGGLYLFIQLYWGFVQPGILAAFLLGMLFKKIHGKAAFTGMLLNIPVYGILLWLLPNIAFLHHMMISFIAIVIWMLAYSYMFPSKTTRHIEITNIKTEKLPRLVKIWGMAIVVATLGLYILFF